MSKPVDWEAYLDAMSAMIGMTIPAGHREATIAQLKRNAEIAQPLLAFDMPEGTNPAPVFKP
jgi:1-carboxybiuret hydrolase subunit AtzG-like protein